MTTRQLVALRPDLLTEAQLSSLVVEVARISGWTCRYHTLRSKGSSHGFPDWVLCKPPRIIFAELKSETGRLSEAQQQWLDALNAVAAMNPLIEVHVWRPSQWEAIVESLTGRKPVPNAGPGKAAA